MIVVEDSAEGARLLADAVDRAERVVVFTGAGISTESGIPDYRSPGGLWTKIQPIYFQEFVASEEARLADWRRRFRFRHEVEAAAPNQGHLAIARLIASGKASRVITQNIDGLHQRAGVPADRIIELHGNATYATCLDCGRRYELDLMEEVIERTGSSPRCRACGGLVKAAVISFGQAMPTWEMKQAEYAMEDADLCIAVGSSLQVQPAASLPMAAKYNGSQLVIVNRDPTPLDEIADLVLRGSIGEVFASL